MIGKRSRSIDRILPYVVGLLLVLVLGFQFSSLYYFPQYDGARYWGDEFGQIIELATELEEGFARIPTGRGATVEVTNGIVRGNSWLAAITYGLPAVLFYPSFDLVSIGRTVTALLSIGLLAMMFILLRRMGTSRLIALAAILLFISCRSFVFATHSARLDIAAGLAVLAWVGYLWLQHRKFIIGYWQPSKMWCFRFGVCTFALATFSIHLLTLLGPVAVYTLYVFGKEQRAKTTLAGVAGVLTIAAILFLTYLATGAPITLFGESSSKLQSHDVLSAMPAFRPFSWSVQSSNIVQRFEQFLSEAPLMLALLVLTIGVAIWKWESLHSSSRFVLILAAIIFVCWLEFQSSAVYYLLHITPLILFVGVMTLRTLELRRWRMTIAFGAVAVVILHVTELQVAMVNAKLIDDNNKSAIATIAERTAGGKSRVISQYPAVSHLHREIGPRLMTTHFINFPRDSSSVSSVLDKLYVGHLALYRTSRAADYSFEVDPLWRVASASGAIDTIITGLLFDVGVDYFSELSGTDTMYLIKLK